MFSFVRKFKNKLKRKMAQFSNCLETKGMPCLTRHMLYI